MIDELLNASVVVRAHETFPDRLSGTVVGRSGDAIAIRLETPLALAGKTEAAYLVASVRHENRRIEDILSCKRVACNLVLVSAARFDTAKPCDVSWWRGGGAAIGDVEIARHAP